MKRAFTMIELIFVIVVVGILAKYGANLLHTVYETYTSSTLNNRLQSDVELTLKQITNRLQYRIKDSVIARNGGAIAGLQAAGGNETILEWIGYDIDGWYGTSRAGANGEPVFNRPTWSGFIDVDDAGAVASVATPPSYLQSPETDSGLANTVIQAVSPNAAGTGFNNAAIFFTGQNSNPGTDYGWVGGAAIATQVDVAAHRIQTGGAIDQLQDSTGATFANTDIYENYKLAWTAYAISLEDFDGDGATHLDSVGNVVPTLDLVLYYDYQPWEGELFNGARSTRVLLQENVETFKFQAVGDSIKVQVCTHDNNLLQSAQGAYSICKETAIF